MVRSAEITEKRKQKGLLIYVIYRTSGKDSKPVLRFDDISPAEVSVRYENGQEIPQPVIESKANAYLTMLNLNPA